MTIDRVLQKQRAKELLRTSKPSMLLAGMLYMLLTVIVSWLSLRLTGVDGETAMQAMDAISNGNSDQALILLEGAVPGGGASLIDMLLQLALTIVSVGFSLFVLNSVRNAGPVLGNLLDGFGMLPRLLFLLLLEGLYIFLWSLLFVIPGIIAAYRYSFAVYVMLDHPEYSASECIRRSKEMTQGFKWQLFVLDLSFILWDLASSVPGVGYLVQVYVTPYKEATKVLYYEEVRLAEETVGGVEYV